MQNGNLDLRVIPLPFRFSNGLDNVVNPLIRGAFLWLDRYPDNLSTPQSHTSVLYTSIYHSANVVTSLPQHPPRYHSTLDLTPLAQSCSATVLSRCATCSIVVLGPIDSVSGIDSLSPLSRKYSHSALASRTGPDSRHTQ